MVGRNRKGRKTMQRKKQWDELNEWKEGESEEENSAKKIEREVKQWLEEK